MDLEYTYGELFNMQRVHIHPFLPCLLGKLANATATDVENLIMNHTLFPLFNYFQAENSECRKTMIWSDHAPIQAKSLVGTGSGFINRHKFCPKCVDEMRAQRGYAILDIRHQIPSVEVCFKHECQLISIQAKPSSNEELKSPIDGCEAAACNDKTKAFALYCNDFLESRIVSVQAQYDPIVYAQRLDDMGLIDKAGFINHSALREGFFEYLSDLELDSGMRSNLSIKFVNQLFLHKTHDKVHPAYHMLFSFWLFEGGIGPYDEISYRSGDVISLVNQGQTLTDIAQETAVSLNVIACIKKLNITPPATRKETAEMKTKREKLEKEIRYHLIILTLLGRSDERIANLLGIDIKAVKREVDKIKGLRMWRFSLKRKRRLVESANVIRRIVNEHPEWTRLRISKESYTEYQYLYRNDRALYESILPPALVRRKKTDS